VTIPYVTFSRIDEYLEEIRQYCGEDGTSDVDSNTIRLTCSEIEQDSMYKPAKYEIESGFRAIDDFFVYRASHDSEMRDFVINRIKSIAEKHGLKVLGGRFQL